MTSQQRNYVGISRAAWGCLFLYFNITIGTINILPTFVAYLLFLSAIHYLEPEQRDLKLLKPLGIILVIWYGADWICRAGGVVIGEKFVIAQLIITVICLYFHFQLYTDFALLAAKYQKVGDTLEKRFLQCRTVQTLFCTLMSLPIWQWWKDDDRVVVIVSIISLVGLIAVFGLLAALFTLRKHFTSTSENQ